MLAAKLQARDLNDILAHTSEMWEELRGRRIFITGGTGFFGSWLLESFVFANRALTLGARACVLTRKPSAFLKKAPHLANDPAVELVEGDLTSFAFPDGEFSHVIHAATETDSVNDPLEPITLFDANVLATRRILSFCKTCGSPKLLFTSSGAVYGPQPPEIRYLPETYVGAPSTLNAGSAYGQSKRVSEFLCAVYGARHGVKVKIARCFAFVGPHLPLDANYAIGNFVRDALRGGPIKVSGDGSPFRSYLYAADLAIWLWTILFQGACGQAYNVGSDRDLTIAELARLVAATVNTRAEVIIAQSPDPTRPSPRYVPSIERARSELGLQPWIDLHESVRRTAIWYSNSAQ